MEYLFECKYDDSEELLRQMYRKALQKKVITWVAISVALGLAMLCLGVVRDRLAYRWGSLLYFALAFWYYLWPRRVARKAFKNSVKYYEGVIPPTVVRFADAITLTQAETVITIPYEKLKQVSLMKDCLLLHDTIGGIYLVSDERFTKETKEKLLLFLKEKCPSLKLPNGNWDRWNNN